MQNIGTEINQYLKRLDPSAAKAVRAARNNQRFAAAVARVWEDNPLAGDFVLAHVNSLYFAKEEVVSKGAENAWRRVLGVYLDDPSARAELNARRETLALALLQDGFSFDEVRILASRMGMRERRAFPEARKRVDAILSGKQPVPNEKSAADPAVPSAKTASSNQPLRDEAKLLGVFKRAVCLALADIDYAAAFLERIEGASLAVRGGSRKRRQSRLVFACRLYTSSPAPVGEIVEGYAPSIIAHAKELGLLLSGIEVRESPESLKGCHAFPASGMPRPYRTSLS